MKERLGMCQDCGAVAKRYVMAGKWLCRSCYNKRIENIRSGRKQYGRRIEEGTGKPHPLCQPYRHNDGRKPPSGP